MYAAFSAIFKGKFVLKGKFEILKLQIIIYVSCVPQVNLSEEFNMTSWCSSFVCVHVYACVCNVCVCVCMCVHVCMHVWDRDRDRDSRIGTVWLNIKEV